VIPLEGGHGERTGVGDGELGCGRSTATCLHSEAGEAAALNVDHFLFE